MAEIHSLLRRQLRRVLGAGESVPEAWQPLVEAVDAAYRQFDADRRMLERSLELSSQELLHANGEMRGMFQAFPDVSLRLAADGTVLDLRGGRTTGAHLRAEELIGRRVQEALVAAPIADRFEEAIAEVRATGAVVSLEYSRRHGEGEVHYEVRLVPLAGGDLMMLMRDITERKRAELERRSLELQLRQSQKMEAMGRLAGGVAHDFNNLLTAILGYSELVSDAVADPVVRAQLAEVRNAGERAAGLTRQLLAFSRKQVLQPRVLSLNGVVEGLHKMLERLIGEDVRVRTHLDPRLHRVRADAGGLEQVIVNLVVNARDAMPNGGELVLKTSNASAVEVNAQQPVAVGGGEYVLLEVVDSGCGMDRETLSRAFEPFFTTKEKGKGTGLGLSTVFGIVEQSGGHIWLSSAPGQGTTVRVCLPMVDAPPEAPAGRVDTTRRHGSGTVLVLEDEQALRALARTLLTSVGYEVLESCCAAEAVRLAESFPGPIDLLLADIVLPDQSGPAVAEKIRAHRPDLKVMFMSGYPDTALLHHGVLDSGAAFLQKPFAASALLGTIEEVLREGSRPRPGAGHLDRLDCGPLAGARLEPVAAGHVLDRAEPVGT